VERSFPNPTNFLPSRETSFAESGHLALDQKKFDRFATATGSKHVVVRDLAMDQMILSKLGEYLLEHREEIIGEWLRAIERDPHICSSDLLRYKELVDHLPKLFENLAELLKSLQSKPQRSEVSRDARVHGKYRWRQGYRLEEVIREAGIVRHILFDKWLNAFAGEVPEFDGETREAAENIIHQAVDDIFTDSAEQFVEEQQKGRSLGQRFW